MTYKNPQKFDLKIRLYNQEKSFGKGVYELMKKAQSFCSLSGAYKDMKMSNSKACLNPLPLLDRKSVV